MLSVDGVQLRGTDEKVGVPAVTTGELGGAASTVPWATSSRSKMPSPLLAWAWWSSTAIVLSPSCTSEAGTTYSNHVVSPAPEVNDDARVVALSAPVGRLSRTTSTPLT